MWKVTERPTELSIWFNRLTKGAIYRFRVAAVNAAGEGELSDRITLVTTDVPGLPVWADEPILFQDAKNMTIAWREPVLTGSAGVSGYKV